MTFSSSNYIQVSLKMSLFLHVPINKFVLYYTIRCYCRVANRKVLQCSIDFFNLDSNGNNLVKFDTKHDLSKEVSGTLETKVMPNEKA